MTASIELAVLLVVVGPFVVVLCLLNRRDRREAALWTAMGPWLTGIDPELRGEIAVWIRVALWRDRALVIVDVQFADAHLAWHAIERLRPRLPRGTALWVKATTPDGQDGTSRPAPRDGTEPSTRRPSRRDRARRPGHPRPA
jgi:hypothetical protein